MSDLLRRLPFAGSHSSKKKNRGQSLVEFALILPMLLLLVVGGIDVGRVFLGWVALNNSVRVAANYAASNALLVSTGNVGALASYNTMVQNDAKMTNCTPPDPIPVPVYTPGASIGGTATVTLSCQFAVLTPVLSQILGGTVKVSASSTFPVRTGVVANVLGGGPPAPVAAFTATPLTGVAPLSVAFTDTSTGSVATWAWDFGNGTTYGAKNAPPVTYSAAGTYNVTLTVSDGLSSTTATRTITVTMPPGPVAIFTATPTSGNPSLVVTFANTSTGTITGWAWDFGNGQTSTVQNAPIQTYNVAGTFTVTLTVTDALSQSSTATRTIAVTNPVPTCTVPDFKNDTTSDATITKWTDAGFVASNILFNPARPPEFKISPNQSPAARTVGPCASTTVTVKDK